MPVTRIAREPRLARSAWLAIAAALATTFAAPSAEAESITQCSSAYENAQLLRQRAKLVAAREQAAVCARESCPEIARRDCARWSEELRHEIPSVVVVVRDDADRDVAASRVLVDGAPHAEIAAGRAFELDPGAHVFRLERADAPPVERPFTVYQGERDRILRVRVPSPPAPASTRLAAPSQSSPPAPASDRPSYAQAAIAAGFSVVSFGVSAYLGLTGRQQLSDLRGSCAPTCTDAQVSPVRTRLTLSDVTLAAGIVGTGVTIYLFAHTASERATGAASARLEIAPTLGGATAVVDARF